ncbi:MAG: hypothetical protein QOD57_1089 [Actinomycetota bacterium]|nr:hypothetical protein [Actinomycetota bacterium]MDQ1498203.1 hypothetical protein [Actinomycetota bacterium]MDQ1503362.1 hypothetical protein [Actinomycetota bacterium]
MKRSIAMLIGLTLATFLGSTPPANALGIGVCTISGTITFRHSPATPDNGAWQISPGVIQCRGQFNTRELMVRQGSFAGSGSYTVVPSGDGGCLRELGTGTVDYWIPTDEQDVHVKEPHAFLLAGAGAFTTPTLRGLFQIVNEGNCLTTPVTKGLFLAEVTLVRLSTADWTP